MRIIALSTLRAFLANSPTQRDAEQPILAWYKQAAATDWSQPSDIKVDFGNASILQVMNFPDPIEAIKFRMEQTGLTIKDIEPAIGRSNRVYEVLNGKRALTLPMIWELHAMFGIPAESLIKPPTSAA